MLEKQQQEKRDHDGGIQKVASMKSQIQQLETKVSDYEKQIEQYDKTIEEQNKQFQIQLNEFKTIKDQILKKHKDQLKVEQDRANTI